MMYSYQRRRFGRIRASCIVVVLILLVVGGGITYFIYHAITGDVFTLAPHALIALESCSQVHIVGSERETVAIQNGLGGSSYETEGNTLYIKGRRCSEMTVLVPSVSDLLVNASSRIDVSGVTGEMRLTANTITVIQSTLEGKSRLEGDNSLLFHGALGQQSQTTIKALSAPIDIELPKDASFLLDVTGSPKSFSTTFQRVELNVENTNAIADIHSQVGSHPQGELSIQAVNGTVLLTGV